MSVSTRLQRMTFGAVLVLVALAGGLLLLPQFVSEREARAAVGRSLHAITGVEPQIGHAQLALLPRPAIRLEDLRLDDGIRPPFTARSMRATVRLLPLLVGRVEIASLRFESAELGVELGPEGAILVGLPLLADPADASGPSRPELQFVDCTVRLRLAETGAVETVSSVQGALAWSGNGLTASGSFRWRSAPASMNLSIGDLAAIARGERSGLRLRIEADPIRVGFDGGLLYLKGVQADGMLAVDARSLRALFALFAATPPTREGFGPFKLNAQATITPASLALKALTIELDGNRAEGGLALKREARRTTVQATLASESADLTAYASGFALSADGGRDWSREPIRLDTLETIDVDLRLSSRRLTIHATEIGRVAAIATVRNGAFTLSVGEAQFYGGTMRGRAALGRGKDNQPAVKIEANFADFELERGLNELAGIRRLEGKGTLVLALEGAGGTVHAMARDLSGSVALTAAKGVLQGINIEQALRRLERKPLSGAPEFASGRTAFDRLTAKLRIAGGSAKIEEAQVESAAVRVTLAGEASVAHREFDLRGTAMLVRAEQAQNAAAQPFDLPFLVRGPWDRPFLLPDPAALIRRSGAAAPLLDAMRRLNVRDKAAAAADEAAAKSEAAPAGAAATPASQTRPAP